VPVVVTGVISSPIPGIWRRLTLLSRDGSINGLRDEQVVGQLEELGIPRHQLGLAHLLHSWQQARIPPDVALALWLLREQHKKYGCLYRKASMPVEESSPAIRYIQLATDAGETLQTDPTLRGVTQWLLDRQLPDGSIPLIVSAGHGETGQTARSLRALGRLSDPSLVEPVRRMREYLLGSATPQPVGVAWSYSTLDTTVVTGSTSLAVTALIDNGVRAEPITEGLRYLLAAQDERGGWAEVPGYTPTIHNTFNAVRALRAGQAAGLLPEPAGPRLERARRWYRKAVRRTPRSTLDLAFAVRLAAELDLLHTPRVERLARHLIRRRRQILSPTADMYAETEIAAIALLESSRRLDNAPADHPRWPWRFNLPTLPPPFLCPDAYLYELLYSAFKARWWIRTVDALVGAALLDHATGLLLGTIATLGIIGDSVTGALTTSRADLRGILTVTLTAALLLLWFGIKATTRSSAWHGLSTSIGSLAAAATLTWILPAPAPFFPATLTLIGLRWLVTDIVAYTANTSGLLDRLLPKK
jgi:Prenyltransferase and squalene oxidase repeat